MKLAGNLSGFLYQIAWEHTPSSFFVGYTSDACWWNAQCVSVQIPLFAGWTRIVAKDFEYLNPDSQCVLGLHHCYPWLIHYIYLFSCHYVTTYHSYLYIYDVLLDCLFIYSPVNMAMKKSPCSSMIFLTSDLGVGAFLIAMFDDTRVKSQYTPWYIMISLL